MTEIHGPQETKAAVRFCPRCGSASLSFVQNWTQPSNAASCGACGWVGSQDELASVEFTHEFTSEEEIIKALVGDLRGVIAKDLGTVFARYLSKWGFLPDPPDPKLLARYLAAIARATLNAIMKERGLIDTEKADEQRGN